MILNHICSRLKSLAITIIALFKRALCCFSRKRRSSFGECEPLVSVNVGGNINYLVKNDRRNGTERDWNSWDETPRTVDEHIEMYRQKLAETPVPASKTEPDIDFFQDMAPKIIKQTKVLLQNNDEEPNFARLQVKQNVPITVSADLEDWHEEDNGDEPAGWDELDDEKTKQMIRENRRAARAEREQKIKKAKMQQQMHLPPHQLHAISGRVNSK